MKKMLIVGAGNGGMALLRTIHGLNNIAVVGVVDLDPGAPAMKLARTLGIDTGQDVQPFLHFRPDVILEVTGQSQVYERLCSQVETGTLVVSGAVASLMLQLIAEKEKWFDAWRIRQRELDAILNSTHDGMIAVNRDGNVTLFNRAAERLIGLSAKEVMNTWIEDSIPNTRLDHVLRSGIPELNQRQRLPNDVSIVTNRVPVTTKSGEVIGAVAVFRDVTDVLSLTQQVTDLTSMKSHLQAIINSSDDAISVVDTAGNGLLINPAYTRLTGLSPEEVIGKPAETDISEGESIHMKVLRTKKAIRGAHMKVGPLRKDVVVNVAPIIIGGEQKGSVGIIHDMSEMKSLYSELEKARRIIRTLEAKYTFSDIIGESEVMQTAFEQARQAARTPATVLLRGESGTGKELFAHAIHHDSDRKYHQFVRVNCAAISESLLESELFGYEEGAFTGARRGGKKGLFEEASGGTIFLDEIGELAPGIQAKLLRVLQEKEVVRVGGTKPIPINVRVLAATNVDLELAITEQRFRKDLFYRLNVFPIFIPPLRERMEDLGALSIYLIKKYNQEYGRNVEEIDAEAVAELSRYHWPGNVRELENMLGRAMIHMPFHEQVMHLSHLPVLVEERVIEKSSSIKQENGERSLQEVLEETERQHIEQILLTQQGNKTATARQLDISVRSLYYKLKKYGLE
ncbi:sigma-54-dependent Fis family transcriptional regulator [Mechercharimyces sp. CAU 1602]|uniref:sigma-54 interaction domain-containing protein n=1 Tax=Mechercharimyces sp. CAU 1602 TaxID=2973933 RepID=UPI002163C3DA|nr:sigma-54-dependent Fis family transcriptional regulator [Mechercharimyces sp. CAU 1602]MCS1350802.1 sigma-54-dependent Fis family transcriptional regulator [Mechercharimyces sp. CAU 1602]